MSSSKLLIQANLPIIPMNRFILFFLICFNLLTSCQCHESTVPTTQEKKSSSITENWMRENYEDGNTIMILLDPHGEAKTVLSKYAKLAKKYHYTLYASSKIYNGLPITTVNSLIDSLLHSISSIKGNQEIVLAGFSGGAKYALLYAANHSTIKRVIACGAVTEENLTTTPCLLFCGEKDMNYASMRLFNGTNCTHIVWSGKHEWPDEKTFNQAFTVESFWKKNDVQLTDLSKQSLEQEIKLHKSYMEGYGAFSDLVWNDIRQYLAKNSADSKSIRSKGVLSMTSYIYTEHFLKIGQLDQASKYCKRYLEIDPENADAYYFKALIEIRQGQQTESQIDFKKALELGWHETPDKRKDPALSF